MTGKAHDFGCTCKSHLPRPWNRPEHWSQADVDFLEQWFGRRTDESIARSLNRSELGLRLKAKRMGLRKRDVGMSCREVARMFDVDETMVSKIWVRRGLLKASRAPFRQGPHHMLVITDEAVDDFLTRFPQYVDARRIDPASQWAGAEQWYSLPDAYRLTRVVPKRIGLLIRSGTINGRKRGTHWYVP
jgi:hypothetical protein